MTERTESIQLGNYTLEREVLSDLTKLRQPFPVLDLQQDGDAAVDIAKKPGDSLEEKFRFMTRIDAQKRVIPLNPPKWKETRKLTHKWTLLEREHNDKTGYDGAFFEAEINGKPQYFIYSLCTDDTGDVAAIGKMVNGTRPKNVANAEAFTAKCIQAVHEKHPKEDVPIVHVGYSLGGAITEMVEREGRPTIIFDTPPASAVFDKEGVPQSKRDLNLLTVMGPHDAVYNSHGKHNGQILIAGEKFWKTDHVSFNDFWQMNSANHAIYNIGKALDAMPEWKTFPAEKWTRTTDLFDAFAVYLDENTQGRKLKWDEALLVNEVKKLQEPQNHEKAQKFALFMFNALSDVLGVVNNAGKQTRGYAEAVQAERQNDTIHPDVIIATKQAKTAISR